MTTARDRATAWVQAMEDMALGRLPLTSQELRHEDVKELLREREQALEECRRQGRPRRMREIVTATTLVDRCIDRLTPGIGWPERATIHDTILTATERDTLEEESYSEGYNDGYDDGYDDGYGDGKQGKPRDPQMGAAAAAVSRKGVKA